MKASEARERATQNKNFVPDMEKVFEKIETAVNQGEFEVLITFGLNGKQQRHLKFLGYRCKATVGEYNTTDYQISWGII